MGSFQEKMFLCISAIHKALKNLVCHVWCILQYYASWVINRNKQSVRLDAEWECPSVSLNKCTTPSPVKELFAQL